MSALTKFYTHPAKSDADVSTYEHGSHVYEVAKWLCRRLNISFTPELGLSALLHDVGKLEMTPKEVEQAGQWNHTGEDALKWLDQVRRDERFEQILTLIREDEAVEGEVNLDEQWDHIEAFVEKHHHGGAELATWQDAYLVMAADSIASVLATGQTGSIETLLETGTGRIPGFTQATLANIRDLIARRQESDATWERLLASEIHQVSLPGTRMGDVLAATSVFNSLPEEALPPRRIVYQDGATLFVEGTREEIEEWLKQEGEWRSFHMGTVATNTYGDQYVRSVLGEPGTRLVPIGKREMEDGYAPFTASKLNPANVEPILSDELANGLVAKYLRHNEYEESFRKIGIEVTEWQSKIRYRGWEAIEELYDATIAAVDAHAADHDNDAHYPPSLDAVPARNEDNEWALSEHNSSKWKPTNESFEATFEEYRCLTYFSNYHHNAISAPTLFEYLDQAKENEGYSVSLEGLVEIDNRIPNGSAAGDEPCAACLERPASVAGKAIVAPEPKTPSRTRAESNNIVRPDPQVNLCPWCFFIGVITLPLKTQIEKGTARTHAVDMVSLVAPLPRARMRELLDAITETAMESSEASAPEETTDQVDAIVEWTEEMTDRSSPPVPILDFADSLRTFDEPPRGFVLPSFNTLETTATIKRSFTSRRNVVAETYQEFPAADFLHHLLEEPITPIRVSYGDPLTDHRRSVSMLARDDFVSAETNDELHGRPLIGVDPKSSVLQAQAEDFEWPTTAERVISDLELVQDSYLPRITFRGELLPVARLWAMSHAFRLVRDYGWYSRSGDRKYRWELLRMFVDHPKQIANSLLRHVRRHQDDDGPAPSLLNSAQIVDFTLMTEQASTHLEPNDRLVENLGTWMTWFVVETNLVDRYRSMYDPEGDYEPITNEVVDPIRRARTHGDFLKWATDIARLSRRKNDEAREQGYSTLLATEDVERLMAFAKAAKAVCRDRGLREEDVLKDIEDMDMALYFSVTSGVIDVDELERFHEALLDEAGVELTEVEAPSANNESTE